MPQTGIVLFAEDDGTCPLLAWLDALPPKVQDKCLVRIARLGELGHELRRPEADYLRDGIYELRSSLRDIQYRILYFFYQTQAILSHGIVKKRTVPIKEIDMALRRKTRFERNPARHTHQGNIA